jgi:type I restriction enzyme, S subunit
MKSGWQTKTVSEIAKHSLGKMLDKSKNKGEPRPYLRNLNVRWFEFDLSDVLEMKFLPEESEKYMAVKGDVLICEGGYPGRAAIWEYDEPVYFQKALHRVRFHEPGRNKWFLYYLLFKDLEGSLRTHFNGSGIQHFTGEALAKFPVPLPPLAEQRRIVGILDEAFAGIATAKANTETSLRNARAVFESHLQSVFGTPGIGWTTTSLADCLELVTYGFTNPMPTTTAGPYMITAKNVVGGRIDYASTRRTSREAFEKLLTEKSRPKIGDVLLTKDGTLGRVAVVDQSDTCINQSVALLRPNGRISSDFMRWLLSSSDYQKRMVEDAGGATIKHIYITRVDKMVIAFPESPAVQVKIVESLDRFSRETQRLVSIYAQKLAALDSLKQSLLHEAFSGRL